MASNQGSGSDAHAFFMDPCLVRWCRRSKCWMGIDQGFQFCRTQWNAAATHFGCFAALPMKRGKSLDVFLSRSSFAHRLDIYHKFCELRRYSSAIVRSAFPLISFLIVFGLNHIIHVQSSLSDIGKSVNLHAINRAEQFLFRCHPHQLISDLWHPILDILSAIPYMCHYAIPVLFPLFLACAGRMGDIPRFYWLLGLSNWMLYLVWWCFPHAPPWVMLHLSRLKSSSQPFERVERLLNSINTSDIQFILAHKEGTAFRRLDERFGTHFFFNLFAGSPVPFACFPSGHVAWSFTVFLLGAPGGRAFFIYVIWMAWATMYSFHHYLLDVFGGIAAVLVTDRLMKAFDFYGSSVAQMQTKIAAVSDLGKVMPSGTPSGKTIFNSISWAEDAVGNNPLKTGVENDSHQLQQFVSIDLNVRNEPMRILSRAESSASCQGISFGSGEFGGEGSIQREFDSMSSTDKTADPAKGHLPAVADTHDRHESVAAEVMPGVQCDIVLQVPGYEVKRRPIEI